MANTPTVQTLDQIMAELQPGYSGQKSVINQQMANTDATAKAAQLGLDAAKTQGFNNINTQATGRGLAFGGVPLDEQYNYLSTEYLPGVQKAKAQQAADKLTLSGQLASLDTDARNRAMSTRDSQQSSLNQWNLQQSQLEAQAKLAREQAAATARENALNRAASAREAAANRAASNTTPTVSQYVASQFAAMGSDPEWRNSGATENSGLIGNLVANYGYSLKDAKKLVYDYRKNTYGF